MSETAPGTELARGGEGGVDRPGPARHAPGRAQPRADGAGRGGARDRPRACPAFRRSRPCRRCRRCCWCRRTAPSVSASTSCSPPSCRSTGSCARCAPTGSGFPTGRPTTTPTPPGTPACATGSTTSTPGSDGSSSGSPRSTTASPTTGTSSRRRWRSSTAATSPHSPRPLSASYHNVWMWLHQRLLLMLGHQQGGGRGARGAARQGAERLMTSASPPTSTRFLVPYGQASARGLTVEDIGEHGAQLDRLVALGLPTVPGVSVDGRLVAPAVRPGRGGPDGGARRGARRAGRWGTRQADAAAALRQRGTSGRRSARSPDRHRAHGRPRGAHQRHLRSSARRPRPRGSRSCARWPRERWRSTWTTSRTSCSTSPTRTSRSWRCCSCARTRAVAPVPDEPSEQLALAATGVLRAVGLSSGPARPQRPGPPAAPRDRAARRGRPDRPQRPVRVRHRGEQARHDRRARSARHLLPRHPPRGRARGRGGGAHAAGRRLRAAAACPGHPRAPLRHGRAGRVRSA